jgi:hypothetical protein
MGGPLVGMLEYTALQTHQEIGAGDEFPPTFNRGIVGDAIIRPAQLIFGVFEAIFNPGA